MLSSQQIDTISGIVENYDHYVVYYYADYHEYHAGEVRDSRIEIYVGSDITVENDNFIFGEDVSCYYFTSGKYLTVQNCPDYFNVHDNELVYTDLLEVYPDLCYFETKYNNFDYRSPLVGFFVCVIAIIVLTRVMFSGGK